MPIRPRPVTAAAFLVLFAALVPTALMPRHVRAAAGFADDFEAWSVNTDLTSAGANPGTPYGAVNTTHAMVRQYPGDPVNVTQVVEMAGSASGILTTFNSVVPGGITGRIDARVDLLPLAGTQNKIVFWQNDNGSGAHYGAFVGVEKFTAGPVFYYFTAHGDSGHGPLTATGNPLDPVVQIDPTKWYRMHITMNVNAINGALTTYDVVVDNLTDGLLGFAKRFNVNANGAATSITGGEFFVTSNGVELSNARWDNLQFFIPEPASASALLCLGLLVARRRIAM